jgi:hypothetical protein
MSTTPPGSISSSVLSEIMVFHMAVLLSVRKKAFFDSQDGFIGTAPDLVANAVQPGDRIGIFQGLEVPVILRPKADGRYMFISGCYLHGVMYGEAMEDGSVTTEEIALA